MADTITGNTQLTATKNDLIIALVQRELKFAAKLMPYTTDYSAYVGKGMKSVKVPKLTSFTAVNRTTATPGDATALTTSTDTIDLDQRVFVSWLVDSSDEIQSSIDVQMENAKRAATAHARYIDTYLISILEASAGFDQGAATTITRDIILDMREYLLATGFALRENLVLAVPPAQEKAMLKIDEFTRGDAYGSSNIPSGIIGQVFGVPVLVHAGLSSTVAYMWDKNAIGVAFQKQPKLQSQPEIQYGTDSERVVMDQLFGAEALQQGEGGTTPPATPLIAKM